MNKRNIIIGGVIIIAIIAAIGLYNVLQLRNFQFPTAAEAGVSFQTIPSIRPEGSTCLNQERGEKDGKAKELMNLDTRLVVIGFGDNAIPNSQWADYKPSLPWAKNIDRHMTVDSSCIYRSPTAPADCEGAECRDSQEIAGYEWVDLAIVHSQDCLPTADAGCTATEIPPGALDVKVMSKCHILVWEDEVYELVDPAGNSYVMQATATGTPDLNVTLPEGWTVTLVTLEEPLEIPPHGGGDNCYHNVLRDHLGQTYHQYVFAGETYP